MNDSLRTALKNLRLSGLLESLDVRLQEAASHGLNHAEFLELVLQDELVVRSDRLLQRRVKVAGFRDLKTLEGMVFLSRNTEITQTTLSRIKSCPDKIESTVQIVPE